MMIVAAVNAKLSWYAARASGLIAWSIMTASIVMGLVVATRLVRRRRVPAWLLDLHKFLGTLSMLFVAVHVFALWTDNYVYFGPGALLVPLASDWRPFSVAWGIAAAYLLVAIQLTSWTMRRIPRRLWHAVHMTSLPMFVLATVHGFTAGADYGSLAVQWGALTGGLLVIFLLTFRTLAPRRVRRAGREPRPVSLTAS
jgi:predicted ferric reductase